MNKSDGPSSKRSITTATKITIGRLLLIPVFVGFAVYYGQTVSEGTPVELYRWLAVATFILASVSDALDGYIARNFNQHSRLGKILDPAADKGLMLAAVITLTFSSWPGGLPLWLTTIIISRDVLLILGALLLNHVAGHVRIRAHWTGKVATCFQMVLLAWVMLQFPEGVLKQVILAIAGTFTFLSAVLYVTDGIHQAQASGHGEAEND